MRNSHFFVLGFILILLSQACTERMICPAYQSAFIHDEGTLERRFSYFNEDSTPKVLEASKSKYLIIEPVSYRKKLRSLRTIEMKDIYPMEDDSLEFAAEFALAEVDKGGDLYDSADLVKDIEYRNNRPPADTTPVDTSYVISIVKEKFNIDQELYLWYMRKYLIYPDVKIQLAEEAEQAAVTEAEEGKEKKGFFGFFKNLFKKKDKGDELELAETDGTEEDTNATEVSDPALDGEKEKKKPFGFLKKKKDKKPKEKKKKKKKENPPEDQEDEDDDDGEEDF